MNGMLSRAPANLSPLVTSQAFASPSSVDSNKRFCKGWPSSGRSDLLVEPTSVLDIRSPSPSSTLSSSFAGSCEGGLGSIESGAVAVSGLFCEAASDGQLPDCTSLSDANEGSVWEIAGDNGRAGEEEFVGAVSSWHADTEMGSKPGGAWEKIGHFQDAGVVGAHKNAGGGQSGGMNGGMGDNAAGAGYGGGRAASVVVAQGKQQQQQQGKCWEEGVENSFKVEAVAYGKQAVKEEMVAEGRLEACVMGCFEVRREGGDGLGEVVEQQRGGGGKAEEEWWSEAADGKPLGSMEDLEDMLLRSPPPPAPEWWLEGDDPPILLPPPPARQQLHEPAGYPHRNNNSAGMRTQLDLHEAMQTGLLCSGGGGCGAAQPAQALAGFPSARGLLPNVGFPPVSDAPLAAFSAPLPPPSFAEPPPQLHLRHPSSALPPPFAAPDFDHFKLPLQQQLPLPQHLLRHSAPLLPTFSSSPHLPFQAPPELLPRAQHFPLPFSFPPPDHFLVPKGFPGPQDAELLQKQPQWQHHQQQLQLPHPQQLLLKPDPGAWPPAPRQSPEDPFPRLVKSPPPCGSQDRVLPPPDRRHIQLQHPELDSRAQSRLLGRNVRLDELLASERQLRKAAEAADHGDLAIAQAILARLNLPKGQPSQRAAFHFKEALEKLIAGSGCSLQPSSNSPLEIIKKISAYKSFREFSPLPQFAHFTANQAILEAMEAEDRVHLIDFELGLGGQWASFMQEISQRSRGPPGLRITTVGSDSLEMQLARENLRQFARDLNISLEFQALPVARLDSLTASMFALREKEAVAVNFGFGLNLRLADFSCAEALTAFLQLIKSLAPKVVTAVDNEIECDGSSHFFEYLQFYACLFESLECCSNKLSREAVLSIESLLFAPKIASAVNGIRRMDNLPPWRVLLQRAGFAPLNFSNAAEAQAGCLIRNPSIGFKVDKKQGSLVLFWYNKPLLSASAWLSMHNSSSPTFI